MRVLIGISRIKQIRTAMVRGVLESGFWKRGGLSYDYSGAEEQGSTGGLPEAAAQWQIKILRRISTLAKPLEERQAVLTPGVHYRRRGGDLRPAAVWPCIRPF